MFDRVLSSRARTGLGEAAAQQPDRVEHQQKEGVFNFSPNLLLRQSEKKWTLTSHHTHLQVNEQQ